jgi:O-antigen/teichoic acid export membrane protein
MLRLKQLGQDSFVYGLGGIMSHGFSFLLIPIYTRVFSLADYGNIEMLIVISSFFGAVLGMGLDSAQSNYFFKVKKEGQDAQARIVSAIIQLRLSFGIGIVLIGTMMAPLLNSWFFQGKLSSEYFVIAFVGVFFSQAMSQSAEIMRLLYRPWSYIAIILSQSILAATIILIFVFIFNEGIFSFFLGTAISSMFVAISGWYQIRSYIQFDKLHWKLWPQLLRFGAPFVPSSMAIYFMTTADRWFVQYYNGEEALGLFAVAAKFSMILSLAVETFRKAWWPIAMEAMHSKDGRVTFRTFARLYMGLACAGVVLLTYLSDYLLQLLTAAEFHNAWPLVGILSWQVVFYGFFLISSGGIWKSEKTYLNIYLSIISAIIGVLLNWILVPTFGGFGAAIATALTFFLWALLSLLISEHYWRVGYPLVRMSLQIVSATIFVATFLWFRPGYTFSIFILTFLLILFLIISSLTKKNYYIIWNDICRLFYR